MKILSTFLIFVFLLSCMTCAQEKKNPIEGTTWKLTSSKWMREDTTFVFPASPYDQVITIYGKTYWAYVSQDTSLKLDMAILGMYSVDEDNIILTIKMAPNHKDIGSSITMEFKIDGDKMIQKTGDYHWAGYKWKGFDQVWSRMTSEQDKNNTLAGTTWELTSGKWTREDTTITFPYSPSDQYIGIFGQTYWIIVNQDTSRDVIEGSSITYGIDGDNFTLIPKIHLIYDTIGKTYISKFKIEGDQLIFDYTDLQWGDYLWKSGRNIWKRID